MKKRSSTEIEKEMEAERATIKGMQGKLNTAQKDRAKAEAAQDANSYDAIAKEDPKAQERLDAAEDALTKADHRVQSIQKAIGIATEKHNGLVAEWKRALNREALEKWQDLARRRIELAPRLDKVIDELAATLAQFNQITAAMRPIKQALGMGAKLHEGNAHDWLRARLFPITGVLNIDKTFRYVSDQKSLAALEGLCFEQLLAMTDVPEGGGSGPEAEPNGEDRGDGGSYTGEHANEETVAST